MSDSGRWLFDFRDDPGRRVDGLVPVEGFQPSGAAEVVVVMEKARDYGAKAVFFEAGRDGRPDVAQAFIFVSNGPEDDPGFAETHRKLWSWGGVPLAYRVQPGLLQLFRCAHLPDFLAQDGTRICHPFKTLRIAGRISADPWWRNDLLRNGTLWDDPKVCSRLLSAENAAHRSLFDKIKQRFVGLNDQQILPGRLRRKLLILSLMIAYLEERRVLLPEYFGSFRRGAEHFFEVLADGPALVKMLDDLENRFNGNIFGLPDADRGRLQASDGQLEKFASFVEGREETGGQLSLWRLYSFADLPVGLISQVYQLFVSDPGTAVYTPPFLVGLMLDEALNSARMDRLMEKDEVILDPACGSCVFLVEAYKRLVLHWRSQHDWIEPQPKVLRSLLGKVHGIDVDAGAIELGAFSLCLALCDALKPETIRASYKLFPELVGKSLHRSCFFERMEQALLPGRVGVVIGNPPFQSEFKTDGGMRAYEKYLRAGHSLPDKQVAYLFLHEAMDCLAPGGVLCLLQQYNFLYNHLSLDFRRNFFQRWDVREILDFISVRGLFRSAGADTKVVVVLAEANKAADQRKILHATFRRSGRVEAEQGFDIDYYDLHWLPRRLVVENDGVWRANLLGGGRALSLTDRLGKFRTLGQYAEEMHWEVGEGFIFGDCDDPRPADHVVGKPCVTASELLDGPIDSSSFTKVPNRPMQRPRRKEIYEPPLLLIHKHEDLHYGTWDESYLTYQHTILGISGAKGNAEEIRTVVSWLTAQKKVLQAVVASAGTAAFASKATAILSNDILAIPFPEAGDLGLSANEKILIEDIVDHLRAFVRKGEKSAVMKANGSAGLPAFRDVYSRQINAIYKKNKLQALEPQTWPGIICQPFVFGKGKVDWNGVEQLKEKLDGLLKDQRRPSLHITRIARIYDGNFVFLLKPDRLRFWLRSIALRDADETLADLRAQGF
jgi:hypothetical protein